MNAPRYRIGNDLSVFWAIHNRDGSPFSMEGKNIRLFVTNERERKEVYPILTSLPDGTINNVIRWDFKGEDQRVLGLHTLTVEITESATHREIIRDYCQAFELVGRSELETEEGDANISIGGDLILSSKLDIYRFEATNADLSGIKESIHDLNETIKDINEEALEIKVTINGIQSQVNDIGTEMTTKASVDSVIELGDQITEVQTNVAEQTIRVNSLEAEISTKASAESITQIADELAITNESLAEQAIKVTDLTAEVSTKASSEMVTKIGNDLTLVNETVAEQTIKVSDLESEIATKASSESVLTLEGGVAAVEKAVAEQTIKVEGLEASIESKVSKEEFNEKTGELDTKYTNLKQTADNLTIEVGEQGVSLTKVVADVNGLSVRVDDIGEAQANYDKTLSELTDILTPEEMSTQIGKGVVLSTVIATRDTDGNITAGMNASSVHYDPVHGRVVFAGGVKNKTDWTKATGILYEDGHIVMNSGEFGENVKIGNAMFRAVLEGDFDLFSYPENGTLVPLFQVNKDSSGKIVSISTPYDFTVNRNLVVFGDTSSGGEGGSSSVGIQGILLNGTTYRDENSDGIIDLGVISGGGGLTSVDWDDVQNKPVFGTLAYANGVTWAQVSGLLAGGDEFNIVPSGHNGVFSFNHRAKDGGSATITEYRMRNGSGSYAPVRASSFIVHGGTSSQFLKADGSLDVTSYLSTSGGTITSAEYAPLIIKRATVNGVAIRFENSSGLLGNLGIAPSDSGAYPIFGNGTTNYTLLHSGNVGDYALKTNGSNTMNASLKIANGQSIQFYGSGGSAVNAFEYTTSDELRVGYQAGLSAGLSLYGTKIGLYSGSRALSMLINSSGNVTIGASDLASTTCKLYVNGAINSSALKTKHICIECDSDGVAGTRNGEINRYTSTLHLQYNTNNALSLCAGGGDVGIGTTSPSFKLHVNGTAKINDIVRLGANLYVSQDSTAYGLQLWGDADGGYLGVHAKGSFKSTNMRFGYDGSATVYGNLIVKGDITA